MFRRRGVTSDSSFLASRLYNEQTFYRGFMNDLSCCTSEAIIESPFMTTRRMNALLPTLRRLGQRGVKITINTRHPDEHDDYMRAEAWACIATLQGMQGVQLLYTGGHHRKLAIFDRRILWEGSLNILSQSDSCEVMRRIESEAIAQQMISFVRLDKFCKR